VDDYFDIGLAPQAPSEFAIVQEDGGHFYRA
jgi:hypothetical protein